MQSTFQTAMIMLLYMQKKLTDFNIGKLPRTKEANARYKNPDNDHVVHGQQII